MSIEDRIGYKFRKKELLFQCLTHKSYGNEEKVPNNERLEFLGDSVLSVVVSKYLYKKLPNFHEGELSKIKNQLVSSKSLSNCVKKFKLEKFLKIGKGENKTKGRLKESNLSCLFEADNRWNIFRFWN
jgi:dsRNA-specific ribonuclease